MPNPLLRIAAPCALAWLTVLCIAGQGTAQTVWSGYDFSFTKADFVDWTLPENQDRITDNVWLARQWQAGLYNINQEGFYTTDISPTDTEWATALMFENDGEPITATNWQDLTFTDWRTAYGGFQELAFNITLFPAVVHLISDDIYLDLQFTAWTQGNGGGFSYDRAAGVPPPSTTGDYNLNGVVDAADYVVWRKTLNLPVPAGSGADGDADGTVDADDYDFWRARFGNLVPGAGGSAAIPEPAAAVLVALAGFCQLLCQGRGCGRAV